MIIAVDETNLLQAAEIHSISWKESHRSFCTPDFVEMHTPESQQVYMRNKMNCGSKFYMLVEDKPIGIYTGADINEKYLKGEFDGYKKWMSSLFTPLRWNYKGEWVIWQYLNRGELEGYSGGERYMDLNVLNRGTDLEDLTVK